MASTTAAEDGGTTDRVAGLPDDVLFEIFSRVQDTSDLLRCALTCKPWLRLFTDRSFLRRLWPEDDHGRQGHRGLLGFFFQKRSFGIRKRAIKRHAKEYYSVCAPTFLPTPGSPLGPGQDRTLTSFVADDDGAFNYAEPLTSRNGFVLMRLIPRTYQRMKTDLVFGLCNPITGERHVAPPLDCACLGRYMNGYAIIMAADHSPPSRRGSTFSQLLVTGYHYHDDSRLHLHVYSAATRSWSAITTRCHHSGSFDLLGANAAVVHRGSAHWLYRSQADYTGSLCILSFEVTTARVSYTQLTISHGWSSSFLCVSGDGSKLSVASVYATQMAVWTQKYGDVAAPWTCTLIEIPPKVPHPVIYSYYSPQHQRRKWFALNKGSLLALYEGGNVFVLDIERKVLNRVMACSEWLFSNAYGMCMPFEVDLSEFFLLRLRGLSRS